MTEPLPEAPRGRSRRPQTTSRPHCERTDWAVVYDSGDGIRARVRRSPVNGSIEAVVEGCELNDDDTLRNAENESSRFPIGDGYVEHDSYLRAAQWIARSI